MTDDPNRLPTKQEILDYIQDSPTPVGKREIARAFQIKGAQRIELKALLRELEAEGAIDKGRKRKMAPKGALPEVGVVMVSDASIDGELYAKPVGPLADIEAEIIVVPGGRATGLPKPGDRLLARFKRIGDNRYEAQPIRILRAGPENILGAITRTPKGWRVKPTDRRIDREYTLNTVPQEVRDGDLVLIRPLPAPSSRRFENLPREAEVVERVGNLSDPKAFSLIAIHQNGIPVAFPEKALAETDKLKPAELGKREDLRDVPLVTIDGADARDFDDAVWAQPDDDEENPGGFKLIVAIADVAHYVKSGSALDKAARLRGNSVYFPDRVVPMLPERLSNDLCSLRPNEDRACMACHMVIDANGQLLRHRFSRALMKSAARLTYTQVQAAMDGTPDDATDTLVEPVLKPLYAAYHALSRARESRGTLELDLPERQVKIGEDGKIAEIVVRQRFDSHKLIEEFMICANVAAAEALEKKQPQTRIPIMYRVHEPPPLDKLEALRDSLAVLGFKLAKGVVVKPRMFTGILAQAEKAGKGPLVSDIVLRSQSQAIYSSNNLGHFGLALRRYCHFTSPIRRYSDVLVHRALVTDYKLGDDGMGAEEIETFDEIADAISGTERRASTAEREATERYVTAYLSDRVGAEFPARISGVARFGLFVALDETGADGLVPISTLSPWDRYHHDEVHHCLVGRENGMAFTLSDRVTVRLTEANALTGGLVFEVIDGGKQASKQILKNIPRAGRGGAFGNRRGGPGGKGGGKGGRKGGGSSKGRPGRKAKR